MSNQELLTWFLATQATGLLAVSVIMLKITQALLDRYSRKMSEEIDAVKRDQAGLLAELEARHITHADRLARVEQDGKHAPNIDDLKRLHGRIDELAKALSRLEGESSAQSHTLHLIHRHLLDHGATK